MAEKKEEKRKGVVGNYNKMPVKKKSYYYDYNDVSKAEKGFADAFSDLSGFNTKLTDELKKEKSVKLTIQGDDDTIKEGLLTRAEWVHNKIEGMREYESYQNAGGRHDFATFLKDAINLVKAGNIIRSGADVAKEQNSSGPRRGPNGRPNKFDDDTLGSEMRGNRYE